MSLWPDYVESPCRENYTYFWSADYMRTAYHCTAIITLPLSLFTFYVIWNVTPPKMRAMKWPMLISHAWSVNLDMMFSVYIMPMVFFPSASGIGLGLLSWLGIGTKWQAYWGQVSIIMMGVGFVTLYENRHSQITTINFKIKKHRTRVLFFGANYLIGFTIMLPYYLTTPDQLEYRQLVLKRIPCPTIEFYDPRTYVILRGGEAAPFWSITIGVSMVFFQTLFFSLHAMYHLAKKAKSVVSESTKAMQRKFLGCVSLQISIPAIAVFIPIIYSMYADKSDHFNQAYNNNTLLAMSNHGILATSCVLYIYKPYRTFITNSIGRKSSTAQVSNTARSEITL